MTFAIQMPPKAGFNENANSVVPITINNEDSEFEIVSKSMEAVRAYFNTFGRKVRITQEDMNFVINQIIIKKVEVIQHIEQEKLRLKQEQTISKNKKEVAQTFSMKDFNESIRKANAKKLSMSILKK